MSIPVFKFAGGAIAVLIAVGIGGRAIYSCGSHSRDDQVRQLSQQIAQSESTVRIKDGLFATKLTEISNLNSLIDGRSVEQKGLLDQLGESDSKLLATQRLVLKWKSAYEGRTDAKQVDAGPSTTMPGVMRKRVDFQRDFGPISVSGHTLTDPAEGEVSVKQTRPLALTVSVARDPLGKWSSLVTSSDPTIDVGVSLGGVDLGVLPTPSWYQKVWIDVSAGGLGDHAVGAGISYRGDRFSVGASCFATIDSKGCGLTGGVRIFK